MKSVNVLSNRMKTKPKDMFEKHNTSGKINNCLFMTNKRKKQIVIITRRCQTKISKINHTYF